jgi:hypothetical protein
MLVAVSACQPQGGARPSTTHEAEGTIRSAREAWNAAFARRDTAALAAQWAQDGELISGAGRWRGRDEIVREFYAGLFQYRPDITFTREPTRIEGHEGAGLVYELGSWVERWWCQRWCQKARRLRARVRRRPVPNSLRFARAGALVLGKLPADQAPGSAHGRIQRCSLRSSPSRSAARTCSPRSGLTLRGSWRQGEGRWEVFHKRTNVRLCA